MSESPELSESGMSWEAIGPDGCHSVTKNLSRDTDVLCSMHGSVINLQVQLIFCSVQNMEYNLHSALNLQCTEIILIEIVPN